MEKSIIRVNLEKMHGLLITSGEPLTLLQLAHRVEISELAVLEALDWEGNDLIISLTNTTPLDGRNPPEIRFVPKEAL